MSREKAKDIIKVVADCFWKHHDHGVQGESELCDSCTRITDESLIAAIVALFPAGECGADCKRNCDRLRRCDIRIDDLESLNAGKGELLLAWQRTEKDRDAIIERKDNELMDLILLKKRAENNLKLTREWGETQEHTLGVCRGTVGNLESEAVVMGELVQTQKDEIRQKDDRIIKLGTTLEAKAGQIQEYDHEIIRVRVEARKKYEGHERQVNELRGLISDRDGTIESLKETVASLREERDEHLVERQQRETITYHESEVKRLAAEVSSYSRIMKEKVDYINELETRLELSKRSEGLLLGKVQQLEAKIEAGKERERQLVDSVQAGNRMKNELKEKWIAEFSRAEKLKDKVEEWNKLNETLSDQNGLFLKEMDDLAIRMSNFVKDNE